MKKIIFLILAVMLFNITTAQDKSSTYNWSVKPGTPKWKELKSYDERLAALQIPVNILSNMSTENLLEMCLNYPLFPYVWAFNSYTEGMNRVFLDFNGFRELTKRTSAGKELLHSYQNISLVDLDSKRTNIERGKFKIRICEHEALLSQPTILGNMSKSDRIILLSNVLDKNKEIRESSKYSFYSYESNSFLAARILSAENSELLNNKLKEDKDFERFFNQGTGLSEKTLNDIVEISNLFLSGNH